jgi:hypothetical protein
MNDRKAGPARRAATPKNPTTTKKPAPAKKTAAANEPAAAKKAAAKAGAQASDTKVSPAKAGATKAVAPRGGEPGATGVVVLVVVAVVLFAMMLRGEHILVTAAGGVPQVAAIQVALFLSSVLLAGLVLGGAGGLGAVRLLGGRLGRRWLLALAGGLVLGVLAGGVAFLLEQGNSTGMALTVGISIAVSGLAGGGAAAIRTGVMVTAGLAGTITVIVVLGLRSLFNTSLIRMFGGGGSVAGYVSAQNTIALLGSIVAGIAAGVTAHLYLRLTERRLGIPGNLLAGATAGLLSLVAQLFTVVAGYPLVRVAGGMGFGDRLAFNLADTYQINGALALLFAGGFVSLVLYGRTRGPRRATVARKAKAAKPKPDWAVKEEAEAAELDRARAAREREATDKRREEAANAD